MKRLITAACAVMCVGVGFAQDPLGEALALVPAQMLLLEPTATVAWADNNAAMESRGLTVPESWGELDQNGTAAILTASSPALVAGLQMNLAMAGSWPDTNGFDLFEVPYQLSFGVPPYHAFVLQGNFSAMQITQALFERHGYELSGPLGDYQLLCPAAGCDTGMNIDMTKLDPTFLFGGDLGRSFPVAVADGTLLSSPSEATIEAITRAASGELTSLYALAEVQAIADRLRESGEVVALRLFNPLAIGPLDPVTAGGPEAFTTLQETMASLPALPPYSLLAVASTAEAGTEHGLLLLTYPDADSAEAASASLAARLETLNSVVSGETYADRLGSFTDEAVTTTVWRYAESDTHLVVLDLSVPIAEPVGNAFTGQLYTRLEHMLSQRDTLWLLPGN